MTIDERDAGRYNEDFRSGVKLCFAKHIWNRIKEQAARRIGKTFPVKHGDRTAVISYVDHNPDQYSKYENGGMPDKAMFTAMTGLEMKCSDLDELPHIDKRLVAGFQYVIYRLSDGRGHAPKESALIPERGIFRCQSLPRAFRE